MNCESQTVIAENTNVYLARVVDSTNTVLQQDDVASARVDLYEVAGSERTSVDLDGVEITDGSAADEPDAEDFISDTLVTPATDSRWTRDSIGFNVSYAIAAPLVDKLYEARLKLTLTSGEIVVCLIKMPSK